MLEDGKLDCEELEALQQMVTEAKGQWAEVVNECRPIAEKFIRHQLADAIADGVVTPEEESEIISNIHLFGLASSLKKEVATAIRRVRLISELRANRLPQPLAQSAPWLQSGEAVYLKKNAELTVNSAIRSSGELWITNTRIEYVASKGGGSTTLKNLRDATGKGDYLVITSVKGNREYFVDEAESIAALLLCLLRMNNRTASQAEEDDTRDDRRRISKEVRNAVWIRDGGACVECGALDYLEFDHVIPVAKGGGNGVNNIQLLCRKCNSKKSDRI